MSGLSVMLSWLKLDQSRHVGERERCYCTVMPASTDDACQHEAQSLPCTTPPNDLLNFSHKPLSSCE